MIRAAFFVTQDDRLLGFHIKGHSGYDESGKDIICAFVSSAAYLSANTITDVIGIRAEVFDQDGEMFLRVDKKDADPCQTILKGLRLHLLGTEEQYPQYLKVTFTEV